MTRVSINGAAGRMGQALVRLISDDADLELVEALEHEQSLALGKDAVGLAGVSSEQMLAIQSEHQNGDVMIDFSLPEGFRSRLNECLNHQTAFVSGTTGLSAEDHKLLEAAATTIPILWAPNFSIGIALLAKLSAEAAQVLDGYDIEIVEMHHRFKKDAPSGTAKRLLRAVCEPLGRDPEADAVHGRVGEPGARTDREIGMHTMRGGDVVGDHTVHFAGLGERIELTHRATSRDTFAKGAIVAAKFLGRQSPGLYTIEDVLFSS